MHYNSLKSRYLRVMLLSLVFLLTAGQLSAKTVFFLNTSKWGPNGDKTVTAHMWGSPTIGDTQWPGAEMTYLLNSGEAGDPDWYYVDAKDYKNIIFSNNGSNQTANQENFSGNTYNNGTWSTSTVQLKNSWGGNEYTYKDLTDDGNGKFSVEAIYDGGGCNWRIDPIKTDDPWISNPNKVGNPQAGDLCKFEFDLSNKELTVTKISSPEPVETTYYLKHPWGGDSWTWKELTADIYGTYSLVANYGGAGCNWNTKSDDNGSQWIGSPELIGNPIVGDECTFTLDPAAKTLKIVKNAPVIYTVETPVISPAGGTYNAVQSVEITCATEGAIICYTTDGSVPTSLSTEYNGAITVGEGITTIKAMAWKEGMNSSDMVEATYTIELPQTGHLYIKVGDGAYTEMDASDGNFTWTGDINNDQLIKFSSNGTDDEAFHFASTTEHTYEVNASAYGNNEVAFGAGKDYIMKWGNGNYTITVPADYSNVTFVQNSVEQTYTIYFKGKESPNAYIWNSDDTSKKNANWPGAAMTKDGDWYKIVLTDADKNNGFNRIIFSKNGAEQTDNLTIPESLWETGEARYDTDHWVVPFAITKVAIFGGLTGSSWSTTETELTEVSEGVYTYQFTAPSGSNKHWAYKVYTTQGDKYFAPNGQAITVELNSETGTDGSLMDNRGNNSYKCEDIHGGGEYLVTMKLNADGTGKVTIKRVGGHTANEIPVFPIGVQSNTELADYNFEANPVVYLLATVLNNNRVSPEWQMTLGTDGKYHLDGFAMRHTYCRDWDGDNNIPGGVKVRVYTAIDSYTDKDEKEFWNAGGALGNLPENPLTEGRLFNAEYDPATETLTLTEDESAQGRMPFISLVGNAMKQDQPYPTPRGIENKPAGQTSDYGWQEAWLQYDENAHIVTDRNDNVLYSTMWPPKNPIYFTANIGGERLYTSENMTFKPQTEEGTYVSKTGAQWMAELKTAEHPEYDGLSLDEEATYYRYIVPDIWYVGSAKIWTGWAGQTTGAGSDQHPIAQWSNHRNWGYGNNMDTGTAISPENTYGVSTADGSNGNFMFNDPTYFKTIEFFYSTEHPNSGSKIYTTLAFGKAQIEAQSHKEGDTYNFGQYKPTVSPDEGVSVLSYIIRCYEAATGKIVALNNGIVAQGDGDPSKANFQDDAIGLAEGKYYYEMEVVFQTANGTRTATVKSNPFIIHFPGVYTLEPVAQQLAQMGTNPNGYVSYSTGNEAIYHVTLNAAGEIESIAPVAEGERADLYKNNFDKNNGINWSDKVLVVAPVPAQFKLDAEKAEPAVSLEAISTYDVTDNGTHKVVAKRNDGSLAYVANTANFDSKAFNAVMNYQDITTSVDKTTEGKAVTVEMMRPNPKAEAANVTVEKVANTDNITVDGKAVATDYYKVCVKLNFGNANVTANSNQPAFAVKAAGETKLYTAKAGESYFTVSYPAVDPVEFTKANVEVAAVYKDKAGNYTLAANMGDAVSANAQMTGFVKDAETQISEFKIAKVQVKNTNYNDYYVTELRSATTGNDKINGENLDVDMYKMSFIVDESALEMPTFFNTKLNFAVADINNFNTADAINFYRMSRDTDPQEEVTIKIAPMYPVLVDGTMNATNLEAVTSSAAGAPALKAEPTYVALYGQEASSTVVLTNDGIVTGIDGVDASKAVQSVRFVNVAGQMSDKPFEGMNIMVTTYTDGTTTTAKVVK